TAKSAKRDTTPRIIFCRETESLSLTVESFYSFKDLFSRSANTCVMYAGLAAPLGPRIFAFSSRESDDRREICRTHQVIAFRRATTSAVPQSRRILGGFSR